MTCLDINENPFSHKNSTAIHKWIKKYFFSTILGPKGFLTPTWKAVIIYVYYCLILSGQINEVAGRGKME